MNLGGLKWFFDIYVWYQVGNVKNPKKGYCLSTPFSSQAGVVKIIYKSWDGGWSITFHHLYILIKQDNGFHISLSSISSIYLTWLHNLTIYVLTTLLKSLYLKFNEHFIPNLILLKPKVRHSWKVFVEKIMCELS